LHNTVRLEGRYSLAYDIAAAYVSVSKRYIRPGVDMLGEMRSGDVVAAQAKYAEFEEWEREAVQDIARMAVEVSVTHKLLSKGQNMLM
jgi:hypothetical protein